MFVITKFKPATIVGTGAWTCAGQGSDSLWNAVQEGRSGLKDGFGFLSDSPRSPDRPAIIATESILETMRSAAWNGLTSDDAILIGTTTGNTELWEEDFMANVRGLISREAFQTSFSREPLGFFADQIQARLNTPARIFIFSTACSASTQAIGIGANWIRSGKFKRCIAGGTEALCRLTREGFRSFGLLSPTPPRPFDRDRNGIQLAEGSAFLALEADASEIEISGFASTSDAFHMTGPEPEGRGCYQAMKKALESAKISPQDVHGVHAHGTGSQQNDLAESIAIGTLFSDSVRVCSTKGIHGHVLGATGAVESIISYHALLNRSFPGTHGYQTPDPQIRISIQKPEMKNRPDSNTPSTNLSTIVKNTLGFGGANASLVIQRRNTDASPQ